MTESMWRIPSISTLRTPMSIMKEQALNLTNQTNGLLDGMVQASGNADIINVSLNIRVPALNFYTYGVATYSQKVLNLYPGEFYNKVDGTSVIVEDEVAFRECLRKLLTSPKMETVLTNLLAQAQAS